MQLNKTMYIDLVDPLPKITHLRRVRKAIAIAIDQIKAQCATLMKISFFTGDYFFITILFAVGHIKQK